MISFLSDHILILVMLLNFALLSTGRLALAVRLAAAQGVLLGFLPGILHPVTWHLGLITVGIIVVKGVLIPWLLFSAIKKAESKREATPFVGFGLILFIGAAVTALAFLYVPRLPLLEAHQGHLFVPASIATMLTGFLLLTTRRKAISQVLGYLILENGIFIFGLLLAEAMPIMVEAGVLLDLLAATFVMGIVIGHINREFSSLDTSRLSALREK